jgi:uncharacterized protein YidB (DUF937 family)
MGLLDILRGMQQGPRGQAQAGGSGGGGMSPITMALMGLLAYKAVKSFAGASAGQPAQAPRGAPESGGGGLGDILGRVLGGQGGGAGDRATTASADDVLPAALKNLLGGAATGSVVSGGLSTLIREFQDRGYGQAAQSWVGNGPNETIAPNDLAKALGSDTLQALAQQTGMPHSDLLASLSQHLPDLINQLTPNGRVPTEEEAARMV